MAFWPASDRLFGVVAAEALEAREAVEDEEAMDEVAEEAESGGEDNVARASTTKTHDNKVNKSYR